MYKLIVGSMVVIVMVALLGYKFIEKGEKIKWMSLKEVQEANIQKVGRLPRAANPKILLVKDRPLI